MGIAQGEAECGHVRDAVEGEFETDYTVGLEKNKEPATEAGGNS